MEPLCRPTFRMQLFHRVLVHSLVPPSIFTKLITQNFGIRIGNWLKVKLHTLLLFPDRLPGMMINVFGI